MVKKNPKKLKWFFTIDQVRLIFLFWNSGKYVETSTLLRKTGCAKIFSVLLKIKKSEMIFVRFFIREDCLNRNTKN